MPLVGPSRHMNKWAHSKGEVIENWIRYNYLNVLAIKIQGIACGIALIVLKRLPDTLPSLPLKIYTSSFNSNAENERKHWNDKFFAILKSFCTLLMRQEASGVFILTLTALLWLVSFCAARSLFTAAQLHRERNAPYCSTRGLIDFFANTEHQRRFFATNM